MAKKRKSRVFWRDGRAWGDFRDFSDVGGKREPLKPPGLNQLATTDPDIAQELASVRLKNLETRRRNKALLGIEKETPLGEYAAYHLREKAQAGFSTRWLTNVERHLQEALQFFGKDRLLASVSTRDVQAFRNHLSLLKGRKQARIGPGTVRHYLNSLSSLYTRAVSESLLPPGFNPVASLMDKPTAPQKEAKWLEVPDAALLLESARTYRPPKGKPAYPHIHELLATMLLTGGRKSEVLGLMAEDVSFDRGTVTFRPNAFRGLKSTAAHRVVPLWPQLEEILRAYVFGGDGPKAGGLLFPSKAVRKRKPEVGPQKETMLDNVDRTLNAIAARIGYKAGEIHAHMFRHTYCAARLQTLDHGHPISPFTVSRELGHGGDSLVKRIYGHLGNVRHRAEAVEYRIEQHDRRALASSILRRSAGNLSASAAAFVAGIAEQDVITNSHL